jgi:[ribosomal protein S5]-alanine N-acetyltransferase
MKNFESERLRMALLQASDQGLYVKCYTSAVLMQHIEVPLSEPAALRSFSSAMNLNSSYPIHRRTWVMQKKSPPENIGLLAFVCRQDSSKATADIGAIIFDEFQNQGFAAEAIGALVEAVFEQTDLTMLCTHHSINNHGANGLMQKLGFKPMQLADSSRHWLLSRADWQEAIRLRAMK